MSVEHLQAENFYQRLAIEEDASHDEVRKAYRALLRRYPPERFPEEFKRIREAYETLSDPEARQEYDTRPNPAVVEPLRRAMAAMEAKDYAGAERNFKRVLVLEPEMAYVRNLLGLALSYQGRHADAVAQLERITALPNPAAAWLGNAGHMYLALERFDDAARAFERAIARADDNPVDYVLGLADALCGKNRFLEAAHVLEKGIHADGTVDFQDLGFFVKLLHVHIRAKRPEDVRHTLLRLKDVTQDPEERTLLAYKVGSLAKSLVWAELFDYAYATAVFARELEPDDLDYQGLVDLSAALEHKNRQATLALLEVHRSFQEGGWLEDLAAWYRGHEAAERMYGDLEPVKAAPELRTINGCGARLYGRWDPDPDNESYTTIRYFTLLFVPILPLGRYRVIEESDGYYRFLGKLPSGSFERWHVGIVAILLLLLFMSPSQGRDVQYSTGSVAPSASAYDFGQSDDTIRESEARDRSRQDIERRRSVLAADIQRLESMESDLKGLRRQADDIKKGLSYISIDDPEYSQLIRRHNRLLDERNALRVDIESRRQALQIEIDAFNAGGN